MSDLKFRPLQIEDKDIYEYYYRESDTAFTDLTFTCRMAWNNVFCNQIAVYEDCCILMSDGGFSTKPHILMPMGKLDSLKLDKILAAVYPEFEKRDWKLQIMGIDEQKIPIIEGLTNFRGELFFNEDASDYLYDANALRTLSGNQLHKKRNHVNKFLRLYANHRYSSIKCEDKDDCLFLVEEWCKSKNISVDDLKESDYFMIRKLFDLCGKVDIQGGVIRVGEKVCAFSLGSLGNNNCAFIHFEKADPAIEGSYSVINQLVLQNEFPDADWVNREEDMGIPGLRKAKQSYFPVKLLRKYKVYLDIR